MTETPLSRAIKLADGPKALGVALGITSQAISQWDVCPALRVLEVERLTGVSRHELRPDIYGPATGSAELQLDPERARPLRCPDPQGAPGLATGGQSR